jgi:hypothetical protein
VNISTFFFAYLVITYYSLQFLSNGNVSALPLASWKSSHYYISAVLLKNTTKQQIVLDPRDLLGKWKSTPFHFNRLGRSADTLPLQAKFFEQENSVINLLALIGTLTTSIFLISLLGA